MGYPTPCLAPPVQMIAPPQLALMRVQGLVHLRRQEVHGHDMLAVRHRRRVGLARLGVPLRSRFAFVKLSLPRYRAIFAVQGVEGENVSVSS